MGTRGATCVVVDGVEKTAYVQYDAYPDGLGVAVLSWLREALTDESEARSLASALTAVPDRDPTDAEWATYADVADRNVSTGRDWYALLRRTQGDIGAMLRIGLYEDAGDWPTDSLFCEWAYVVDFDERLFEVYEGFQRSPATAGRWAGRPLAQDHTAGYYAVQRIAAWSFDDIPSDAALTAIEAAD